MMTLLKSHLITSLILYHTFLVTSYSYVSENCGMSFIEMQLFYYKYRLINNIEVRV